MNGIIAILLSLLLWTGPGEIRKINTAKAEAKKAFNDGNYAEAVKKYRYLVDKLGVTEDEVMLNLAHAYYLSNDTTNARAGYQGLVQSPKNGIRSKALQQLGLMNNKQGKAEEALQDFKQAIKADPSNEDARYNYEMLKKKLDEKKKQEQQKKDQNKDQQNKDDQKKDQDKNDQSKKDQDQKNKDQQGNNQKNKDQKNQQDQKNQDQKNQQEKKDQDKKSDEQKAQEKKDEEKKADEDKADQKKNGEKGIPQDVRDKLNGLNMSPEKLQMVLDAMKDQEIQYLQQNKRKATKPKDKGKPDW